jgi:hypothetical protein
LVRQQQRLRSVRQQQYQLGVRLQGCHWVRVRLAVLPLVAAPSPSQQQVELALWQPRVHLLHLWQHSSRLQPLQQYLVSA